jgi:hypothetical protein
MESCHISRMLHTMGNGPVATYWTDPLLSVCLCIKRILNPADLVLLCACCSSLFVCVCVRAFILHICLCVNDE